VRLVDELREHLGAAQHLHPHRSRGLELWRPLDRPAVDEQVLAQHVLGVVADRDPHAGLLQLVHCLRLLYVAAGDIVAAGQEDARQRGDPGAAHPPQVDLPLPATSCSTARTRCAASWRPAARDARAMALRRSSSRPPNVATSLSPVSSASRMVREAPAAARAAAFSSWCPPPKVPGTRTMGRPTAVISAIVLTPARLTTRSARDIRPAMSSVKAIPV